GPSPLASLRGTKRTTWSPNEVGEVGGNCGRSVPFPLASLRGTKWEARTQVGLGRANYCPSSVALLADRDRPRRSSFRSPRRLRSGGPGRPYAPGFVRLPLVQFGGVGGVDRDPGVGPFGGRRRHRRFRGRGPAGAGGPARSLTGQPGRPAPAVCGPSRRLSDPGRI